MSDVQEPSDYPIDTHTTQTHREETSVFGLSAVPPMAKRLNRNVLTVIAVVIGVIALVALVTVRQPRAGRSSAASPDTTSVPMAAPRPFFEQPSTGPLLLPEPGASSQIPSSSAPETPSHATDDGPMSWDGSPTEPTTDIMSPTPPVSHGVPQDNGSWSTSPISEPPPISPRAERNAAFRAARLSPPVVEFAAVPTTASLPSATSADDASPGAPEPTSNDYPRLTGQLDPTQSPQSGRVLSIDPVRSTALTASTPLHPLEAQTSSIEPLPSPYVIQAGTIIPGLLITGINSELPGQLLGQVSQDVYDSPTQHIPLIPKGSKLIGRYDNQIIVGQNRLLVAWTRLIFPDGRSLTLPGLGITDPQGAAGVTDGVNNHYRTVFGHALLLSLIGAGVQLGQPRQSYEGPYSAPTAGQVAAGGVSQELAQVASAIMRRNLDIQPTITIRPGTAFNIFLNGDVQFPGPYTDARR